MPRMTPDIVKLRDSLPTLEPILDRLELELVDDPTWNEPSDLAPGHRPGAGIGMG